MKLQPRVKEYRKKSVESLCHLNTFEGLFRNSEYFEIKWYTIDFYCLQKTVCGCVFEVQVYL